MELESEILFLMNLTMKFLLDTDISRPLLALMRYRGSELLLQVAQIEAFAFGKLLKNHSLCTMVIRGVLKLLN